jgi:hypothetical protein
MPRDCVAGMMMLMLSCFNFAQVLTLFGLRCSLHCSLHCSAQQIRDSFSSFNTWVEAAKAGAAAIL